MKLKIKELRLEYQLTQEELAKALHINRTTLAKYESGKIKPPMKTILMFANYFHVTVDELTGVNMDTKDVAIQLNTLLTQLNDATTFNGQPLDDGSRELLKQSVMNTVKLCQYLTK